MAQTIVVPLDGSEIGERGLPWATFLAREHGYSLTLARIVRLPYVPVGPYGGYPLPSLYRHIQSAEVAAAESYLDNVAARLRSQGVVVQTMVRSGSAAEGIHDIADEVGAHAIVICSHGRGGVSRLVMGSVAEGLIQQATIPVLLVPAATSDRQPALSRLLVPLDGSALAERGIDEALQLASPAATVVLMRVVEPIRQPIIEGAAVAMVDDSRTREAELEAGSYLDRIAAKLEGAGIRVLTMVKRGYPAAELLGAAVESNVDSIVMTTHGHTGLTRWLMGSVADEVCRNAERPVVLVSARTMAARIAGAYQVKDLMTRDVEYVRDDDSVIAVIRKLLRRRIGSAPVVDVRGELIGVISEQDLLNWEAQLVKGSALANGGPDPAEFVRRMETESVATFVNRHPAEIDESADLNAAARLFEDRELRSLVVTRGGQPVGMLSRADVLRGMAARWQSLSREKSSSRA